MNKSPKDETKPEPQIPAMPFDDALRKLLKAPPNHKVAKPQKKTEKQ